MSKQLTVTMRSDVAKMDLYGSIGNEFFGGISAAEFVSELDAIDRPQVDLHINSGGGSYSEAIAMYNRLKNFAGKVRTVVEGSALSAASLLMLAGHEREVLHGARLMVHEASFPNGGRAEDLRKSADMADQINDEAAQIYAAVTNWSKEDAVQAMAAETWLDATQAHQAGFATVAPVAPSEEHQLAGCGQAVMAMLKTFDHPPVELMTDLEIQRRNSDEALRRIQQARLGNKVTPTLSSMLQQAVRKNPRILQTLAAETPVTMDELNDVHNGTLSTLPVYKLSAMGKIVGMPSAVEMMKAAGHIDNKREKASK